MFLLGTGTPTGWKFGIDPGGAEGNGTARRFFGRTLAPTNGPLDFAVPLATPPPKIVNRPSVKIRNVMATRLISTTPPRPTALLRVGLQNCLLLALSVVRESGGYAPATIA